MTEQNSRRNEHTTIIRPTMSQQIQRGAKAFAISRRVLT